MNTYHVALPDAASERLVGIDDFAEVNGGTTEPDPTIGADTYTVDAARTPWGVRLSPHALNVLTPGEDDFDEDGVLNEDFWIVQGDDGLVMWVGGLSYPVIREDIDAPADDWDDDDIALAVWAGYAPRQQIAVDTNPDDVGGPYIEDPVRAISYLRDVDADWERVCDEANIDANTDRQLLVAAALAGQVAYYRNKRDAAITWCVQHEVTGKRALARDTGLSGTAAIDRITDRNTTKESN